MQLSAQTNAILNVTRKRDSTHGVAPQASAAILLRILRSAYNIQTNILTEHPLLAEKFAKKVYPSTTAGASSYAPPLEEKQPTVASNEETRVEDSLKSQSSLLDYLNRVIETLEKENASEIKHPEHEQNILKHPDIQGTIEFIDRIQQLSYFTKDKKILIFKQMHSLAKTCPGIQWDKNHENWSTNSIYTNRENQQVIASPAETLNLVCKAVLDPSRYSKDQSNDTEHRIISLGIYCLSSQISVEQGQLELCSTGRQHGLLFLLNHSYLDKPNTEASAKPVKLIVDTDVFIMESLTEFLMENISKLSAEQQNKLILNWLLYQSDLLECEIAPVITFLRQQFPMPPPEEKTDNIDEDLKWKDNCILFLATHCLKHGLNPKKINLKEKLIVEQLSCPVIQGTSTPLLQEILNAPSLSINKCFTPEMNGLIELRHRALDAFRNQIKQEFSLVCEENIQMFYIALQYFQKLYHYRHLTVFIGADEAAFFAISDQLQGALITYFKDHVFTKRLPNNFAFAFESIRSNYSAQEKQFREKSHTDMIENFFAKLQRPQDVNPAFKRLEVLKPDGALINPAIFLQDETLESWYKQNSSAISGQTILNLSSYEINRILLHSLTVPLMEWTPNFCYALRLVTEWLAAPGATVLLTAFKKSYNPTLLTNLKFILAITHNAHLNENLKKTICSSFKFMG